MSGEDDGSGYGDRHRAFLQAFMSRSTMKYEEAKPILAAIWSAAERRDVEPEEIGEVVFQDYVNSVNEAISPFDMEIRSTYHQQSKERVYALINLASDPVTQLATTYSADEMAFVKRVLDGMFETNNTVRHEVMAIKGMDAVRLNKPPANRRHTANGTDTQGSAGQGLSMQQAEDMLKALVAQGWFEKSRRGYFSLTPRALMELRGWLLDTYNEDPELDGAEVNPKIKLCHACREIITVGQRCPRITCTCRLHDICTASFFTMQRSRACPKCQTEWTGENFVGERDTLAPRSRPSTDGAADEFRRRSNGNVDESGDEDGERHGESEEARNDEGNRSASD